MADNEEARRTLTALVQKRDRYRKLVEDCDRDLAALEPAYSRLRTEVFFERQFADAASGNETARAAIERFAREVFPRLRGRERDAFRYFDWQPPWLKQRLAVASAVAAAAADDRASAQRPGADSGAGAAQGQAAVGSDSGNGADPDRAAAASGSGNRADSDQRGDASAASAGVDDGRSGQGAPVSVGARRSPGVDVVDADTFRNQLVTGRPGGSDG